MERLHFTIDIDAPREKVWKTMLEDRTYRDWTTAFMPGSYYEGDWSEGSKIRFLGPGEGGKLDGMVSRIKQNRPYEYVSIEHYGIVHDSVEDTTSDEVKKWAGAQENYIFEPRNGGTELRIELDTDDDYKDMFQDMWPKALQRLKELSEK
jgi:uncharacterized protein YndB with AHSA1/START domain